jgi:nucleoside-diphosphate-sugar epimerase
MKKPLAIVTGVPGWLGSNLVDKLLNEHAETATEAPRQIRALTLPGSDTGEFAAHSDRLAFVTGNLITGEGLDTLLADAGGATVFHIAGIIHPQKSRQEFYDLNFSGTKRVMDAAIKAGAKRFVHVSSNSPLGCNKSAAAADYFDETSPYNPYMHYGASKKMGEDLVNDAFKKGSIETVIIRPPWFYGPRQPARQTLFFTMIKNGKMPIVGTGENMRSMAYVDNICQGLMLAESIDRAAGKTYWIADERPYTMNEIVDTVERVLENDFKIACAHKRMHLPDIASEVALAVDATLQGLGLYHQKFHVLSEMNKNIACKIDQARVDLGYNPEIALEEGMRRSIRWILDHGQTI